MRELLEEVLELQKKYSSKNTPEMNRRGVLIRTEIPNSFLEVRDRLVKVMGRTGEDLEFEGRDATGPKSEIPWVRFYSESRSPNAREGWYCVLLFTGDGSGVYLSLGHGSTRWEDGNYKPRSEQELLDHVTWARGVLGEQIKNDSRLVESIDLRFERSKVAESYQRGTAVALWYSDQSLPSESQLTSDFEMFSKMLSLLYNELDLGRTPDSKSLVVQTHLETVRSPRKSSKSSNRQGWGLTSQEKKVVEKHSMSLSEKRLVELGFTDIEDVSSSSPFDYKVKKDGVEYVVEVKGTTGTGDIIILTVNEVGVHKERYPNNLLIVVHSIDLDRTSKIPVPSGGVVEVTFPWKVRETELRPLTFSYDLRETLPTTS